MEEVRNDWVMAQPAIKDYIAVIVNHKCIILLALCTVVLSTMYYVRQIEDEFESYSKIVIEEQSALLNPVLRSNYRPLSFYEGILNSRSFLGGLVDSIGMKTFNSTYPDLSPEGAREYIRSNMGLRKTPYTSFIRLNARAGADELAFLMADKGTKLLMLRCHEMASEESRRTVIEIEKQLAIVKENLKLSEKDYQNFIETVGNLKGGTTPELTTLQDAYTNNLAQIGIMQADFEAEREQLKNIEKRIAPDSRELSPEFYKLREKLKDLETEKMRLENLGIRFSGLSKIDREIREIEQQLLQYQKKTVAPVDPMSLHQWQELRKSVIEKEGELELFRRRLDSYENAIANYKNNNPNIHYQTLELMRIKRAKEVYENIYSILLEKVEEARIRSRSIETGIKIVDEATFPLEPISKNETIFYALSVIIGLTLGVSIAFLLEYNDTSVKTTEDVEKYLGLSVLGSIPHIHLKRKVKDNSSRKGKVAQYTKNIYDISKEDSVILEAYRSLRTNISFVSPDYPFKTIVLTSASPGEGKSLTASNLSMAYAKMGKRTLLVDTDLRRPVQHKIFNLKRENGLTSLFLENTNYEKVIKKTDLDNLSIITAGVFTPNPSELIGSQKMTQLIETFKENFDIVLFDTPPVIAVTDPALLGTKVDGVLLVIKSQCTDRQLVGRAVKSFSNIGVDVNGAVLNNINISRHCNSYGYYKYYKSDMSG
ncbi:polysaccharide biosynthesis tyrosine autokinase [Chitinispirillales bacterium ANBcel5]|uniref:polysaccharide biosynthesis tyrosine autokinase n=1 Tax=Cellulosispirillum alkaliphilum TaxID=3039283 RepID=UPI002A51A6BE|nr:polysaccharide biosynthesis tyrosine autokinase [Chitinispirillales bacterium ANBcel5]